MKNILLLLAVVAFSLSACTEGGKDSVGDLATQVIAVHDEAMPHMGQIMQLRREIAAEIETLEAAPEADSVRVQALAAALDQLNAAKTGMEDWMHAYQTPGKDTPDAEALAYLQSEMAKATKVKDDIFASIANAKELLGR